MRIDIYGFMSYMTIAIEILCIQKKQIEIENDYLAGTWKCHL